MDDRKVLPAIMYFVFIVIGLISICLFPKTHVDAEGVVTKEERMYQLKLQEAELILQKAKLEMEKYEQEYEKMKQLFREDVVALQEMKETEKKYQDAKLAYEQAKIDLEKTKLEFLKDATHISIIEAKKYRTLEGKYMVDITIQNASNVGEAASLMGGLSKEEVENLLEIQNIIISLKKEAIVGEPYEVIIPSLKYNEKKTLSFRLLKDCEDVGIQMKFLDMELVKKIFLKKVAIQDVPTINSAQFSQEGSLGSKVRFDIILERLAEKEENFRLLVLNLPRQLDFSFIDPKSQARINQVKFGEKDSRQQLNLEIAIPEKLEEEYVDRTLEFYVFVIQPREYKQINSMKEKYGSEVLPLEEIKKIKGNYVRLEFIPRGIGELEVVISNRYQEIKEGEIVTIRVDILNSGTLNLINVHIEMDLPYEWQSKVKPSLIREIAAGDKEPVNIEVIPPESIGIGEYDLRVKVVGEIGNEKVESQEKNITIRVGVKANIVGNVVLILVLILLVVGIAVASVKVSRR